MNCGVAFNEIFRQSNVLLLLLLSLPVHVVLRLYGERVSCNTQSFVHLVLCRDFYFYLFIYLFILKGASDNSQCQIILPWSEVAQDILGSNLGGDTEYLD
jgi:hypothetical protein